MTTFTPPDSPCLTGSIYVDPRIGTCIANRFQLVDVLGVGAYGTVYKAQDLVTGQLYAVKAINKSGLDARQQKFHRREIDLHYHASTHPNVLSMHDIITSRDCTFVLLDYCPEGDLFAKITEKGHYVRDDAAARSVFLQLLRAVQFCHSQDIYHRDLKPENIMVSDHGRSIKLADFGLATRDRVSQDFGCGSTFYMSPECQDPNPRPAACYRSAPNDVWALGVVLINLTCGRNPWKRATMSDSTYKAFRNNPDFLKTILPISDELNFVLQRIFEADPVKRITVGQLIPLMERIGMLTVCEEPISPAYTRQSSPTYPDLPATPPVDNLAEQDLLSYQDINDSSAAQSTTDALMDTDTVPSLQLPSPRYIDPQSAIYGNADTMQCQLPPSPPPSNRGSVDYTPYTIQAGTQLKSGFLVEPPYNYFFNADFFPQWNKCNPLQYMPQQWTQQQFAAHYPTAY